MSDNTETILIVDDEIADLAMMREILEKVGYQVLAADHFQSALATFLTQRDQIDATIVDVSLPGRNGCELARELLKLAPGLKILFVSGHVGAEVIRFYGIPAADIHFLQKPFAPPDLLHSLSQVLNSPEPLVWLSPESNNKLKPSDGK
jgi:CheY-like chemotaxis protein